MEEVIHISVDQSTPALRYVLKFIFQDFFELTYELVSREAEGGNTPLIHYGDSPINGAINIFPTGYLSAPDLRRFPTPILHEWQGLPVFYATAGVDLNFDLFSAVFFMISRVEEYLPGERDKHGRFLSAHAQLSDPSLIKRPIVDEWLMAFGNLLHLRYSHFQPVKRRFKWINTIDVDVAFAYAHRPAYRVFGASLKDLFRLNFQKIKTRFNVLRGNTNDPFDTYDFLLENTTSEVESTKFFFLVGNNGVFDKNLSLGNKAFKKVIKELAKRSEVGIHPSYSSNENVGQLQFEVRNLENAVQKPVLSSRQHYLKLTFPTTYRQLIDAGILNDYTLTYSDIVGFRSGTCTPYLFFDVDRNEETALRIFPVAAMDATLRDYMKLEPQAAIAEYRSLISRIQAVSGTFISLWHNESVSDEKEWSGWREVYLAMLRMCINQKI